MCSHLLFALKAITIYQQVLLLHIPHLHLSCLSGYGTSNSTHKPSSSETTCRTRFIYTRSIHCLCVCGEVLMNLWWTVHRPPLWESPIKKVLCVCLSLILMLEIVVNYFINWLFIKPLNELSDSQLAQHQPLQCALPVYLPAAFFSFFLSFFLIK